MGDRVRHPIRHIINLSEHLTDQAVAHVEDPATPYDTISDLAAAAIRNQIALDHDARLGADQGNQVGTAPSERRDLLVRPTSTDVVTADGSSPSGPLTFLTNRMNPFSLVARIAANLDVPPDDFVEQAGGQARAVGVRLRREDERGGGHRSTWRSVSWPVGDDAKSSLQKFTVSYLIDSDGNGPARDAGLLALEDGRVRPTALGARLAVAHSPLFDAEVGDSTRALSADAIDILRQCVLDNRHERASVQQFLKAVVANDGIQGDVDAELASMNAGWSDSHVASHRAAMVGRLRDLDVIEVDGRGHQAHLRIPEQARGFVDVIGAYV